MQNNELNTTISSSGLSDMIQFIPFQEAISFQYNRVYFPVSMMRKLRKRRTTSSERTEEDTESVKSSSSTSSKKSTTKSSNNSKKTNSSTTNSKKVSLVAKGSTTCKVNYCLDGPCIVTLENDIKIIGSTWVIDDSAVSSSEHEQEKNVSNMLAKAQSNVFLCDDDEHAFLKIQDFLNKMQHNITNCKKIQVNNVELLDSLCSENATEIILKPICGPKFKPETNPQTIGMKNLRYHSLYLKNNSIIWFSNSEIYRVVEVKCAASSKQHHVFRIVSATKIVIDSDEFAEKQSSNNYCQYHEFEQTTTTTESNNFFLDSKPCKELLSLLKVANRFFHHTFSSNNNFTTHGGSITITNPYSILVHGPHNIGKTSSVRNISKHLKSPLVYVNCSTLGGGVLGNEQAISSIVNRMYESLERRWNSTNMNNHSTNNSGEITLILFLDDLDKIQQGLFSSLISINEEMKKSENAPKIPNRVIVNIIIVGSSSSDSEFMKKMEMRGKFQREVKFDLPTNEERRQFLELLYSKDFVVNFKTIADSATGFQFYDLIRVFSSLNADKGFNKQQSIKIDTEYVLRRIIELGITPSLKSLTTTIVNNQDDNGEYNEGQANTNNNTGDSSEKHWNKIGGLANLKQKIRQAAEWPMKYPDSFKRLGLQPPRGILLYGVPGTGKTTLVRTLALSINSTFIYCNVAQVYSPYVGEAERAIRDIMSKARMMNPSVVFFDEIDAIVGKRDFSMGGGGGADSVSSRVLSTLLNEMDGIESTKNLLVVAATNRPDMIDSALMRPGRLEHLLHVPPPDYQAKISIFEIHTKSLGEVFLNSIDQLIPRTDFINDLVNSEEISGDMTGAEIEALCREACMAAIRDLEANKQVIPQSMVLSWQNFKDARKRVQPFLSTQEGKKMLAFYETFETSFDKNK